MAEQRRNPPPAGAQPLSASSGEGLRDRAAACAAQGDWAGVVNALQELLPHQVSSYGTNHQGTLLLRRDLAVAMAMSGDSPRASMAFESLIPRFQEVFGPEHEHTRLLHEQLAYLKQITPPPQKTVQDIHLWQVAQQCKENDDLYGAEQALKELLDQQLRTVGPDHLNTLRVRSELSTLLLESDNTYSAVTAFAGLLSDQMRVLGPTHADTLWTRHSLGFARVQAGDTTGGYLAMQETLTDMVRTLGREHPLVALVQEDLDFVDPPRGRQRRRPRHGRG